MNLEEMAERIKYFLEHPEPLDEELLDEAAEKFKWVLKTLEPEEPTTGDRVFRPSLLGKCTRMLGYMYHGFKGEPLTYDTKLTFLTGHILELVLLTIARGAGVPVEGLQKRIDVDGVGGNLDFELGDYVIDIKSQSDISFDIANKKGIDDGFGYPTQLEIYRQGADKEKGGWLTINKNRGTIAVHEYEPKPHKLDIALRKREIVKASTPDNLPERDYDLEVDPKTKKMRLCMQCKFCNFKELCWNITEEIKGYNNSVQFLSSGPKDD